jgi:hypothetical protein
LTALYRLLYKAFSQLKPQTLKFVLLEFTQNFMINLHKDLPKVNKGW